MRIGESAQQNRQRLDLGDSPKAPAPLTSTGMFSDFSALGVWGDPVSLFSGENQEVTEPAAAGIDFRSNIGRDLFGILFLERFAVAVVRESKNAAGCGVAIARIERREARGMHCRLRRKPRLKDLVGPIAQLRRRAKVQSEWHDTPDCRIAEALPNDVVDVDVSSSKAVDGLLGVTHDEQCTRPQRDLPPVRRTFFFVADDAALSSASQNRISACTGSVS